MFIDISTVPNTVIVAIAKSMVEGHAEDFIQAGFSLKRIEGPASYNVQEQIRMLAELLFNDTETLIEHAKEYENEDIELLVTRARNRGYVESKKFGAEYDKEKIEKAIKSLYTIKCRRKAIERLRSSFFAKLNYIMDEMTYNGNNSVKVNYNSSNSGIREIILNIGKYDVSDYTIELENSKQYPFTRNSNIFTNLSDGPHKEIVALLEEFKQKYEELLSSAVVKTD